MTQPQAPEWYRNLPAWLTQPGSEQILQWMNSQFGQQQPVQQQPAAPPAGGPAGPTPSTTQPAGQAGEPSVSGLGTGGTTPTEAAATQQRKSTLTFDPNDPKSISAVWQTAQQQFDDANNRLNDLVKERNDLAAQWQKASQDATLRATLLPDLTQRLNSLDGVISSATSRASQANVNLANVQVAAMDKLGLQPAQIAELSGRAQQELKQAQLLDDQGQVLLAGAQGNRDLVVAQVGEAAARALGETQQADVYRAQADQIRQQTAQLLPAQAALTTQQANQAQSNALLATAQATGLVPAQAAQALGGAQLAGAQAANVAARTPAEIGLLGGQTTGALAGAAQNIAQAGALQAGVQKDLLGPMYGMPEQINAFRDMVNSVAGTVFGPGGSGNPQDANDLLGQYITSKLGGTTPAAAATIAGNLAQQGYATAAGMANAAQAAQAARANAYQALGGNVLGTLAAMNVNAPAGSTALAGAFQDVMGQMANRLNAPQFAAPQTLPQAQMPTFFQKYFSGAQQQPPSAQTSAPVTINIGGTGTPSAPTPAQATSPDWFSQWQQRQAADTAQQRAAANLPGALQSYAPSTPDSVNGLWTNELNAGQVQGIPNAGYT
jgi:hypothetical protein